MDRVASKAARADTSPDTKAGAVVGYVRDACRYWGHMIHRAYGEPFAVREALGLSDWDGIL